MIIALVGMLFTGCSTTKEKETRNVESFDTLNLVGRVELHLVRNADHSVEVMTKNASDIADLITEVRNGELFIYHKKECDTCETPKYIIYLNHSGISDVSLTGVVTLKSEDVISQKDLVIHGDGILNGNLEVSVDNLNVDLKGISNMSISGNADTSNLKVAGIGMINAGSLKTISGKKASEGIAFINN